MLASTAERVREIGIRLAVGARQRDIFWQILIESILVSLGLIEILKSIAPTENVPVLTPDSILLAVGFALAAGLLSGLYPAAKASSIDPITALRYE